MQVTSAGTLPEPLKITVLPDALLLDDRAPARPDTAVAELAELLHAQLIGELTIHPGGDLDGVAQFSAAARPPARVDPRRRGHRARCGR